MRPAQTRVKTLIGMGQTPERALRLAAGEAWYEHQTEYSIRPVRVNGRITRIEMLKGDELIDHSNDVDADSQFTAEYRIARADLAACWMAADACEVAK